MTFSRRTVRLPRPIANTNLLTTLPIQMGGEISVEP
jgi:hypothetical protein